MSIKIVLADDHKILRDGLRSLLEKQKDFQVVAEAADGHEAVALTQRLRPHIVLIDVGMPVLNGIEATRQIKQQFPDIHVLALSMYSDKRYVMEMFKAGASGYLLKDSAFEEVVHAVRTAAGGKVYLSPLIADTVIKELRQFPADTAAPDVTLSSREREILQLLAEGKTTKQIATLLHVSAKTVETHRSRIMNKLNIHTLPELTKYAIREGLTSLEK